jgi:signal transduction histidine kinase
MVLPPDLGHGILSVEGELAATDQIDQLAALACQWARTTVGDGAGVRVSLLDRSGRLRVTCHSGERHGSPAEAVPNFPARRRMVLRSGSISRIELPTPGDRVLDLFPLVARLERFGVLEVAGPIDRVAGSRPTLEAIASRIAVVLRDHAARQRQADELRAVDDALSFQERLARARTAQSAIRAALAFYHRRFALPVAGWLEDAESRTHKLIAVRGIGAEQRERFLDSFGVLVGWQTIHQEARDASRASFATLVGASDAVAVTCGPAVVMGSVHPSSARHPLEVVGRQLGDALERIAGGRARPGREPHRDMELAVTAHELRGPLLGIKAALERLQTGPALTPSDRAVVARTRSVVEDLASVTDDLLRWSNGNQQAERRLVDVTDIVGQAVAASEMESGERRIRFRASPLPARVDPVGLRVATINLIRNAMTHGPSGTEVFVTVRKVTGSIEIAIHDDGPGLDLEPTLFEPFVRGQATNGEGHGLGLFIASRAVEAQGGSIELEPGTNGTTIVIKLPASDEGSQRRVS